MSAQTEFFRGTSCIIFDDMIKEAMNTRYIVSRFPTALDASLVFSRPTRIKAPRRTTGVVSVSLATSLAKCSNRGSSSGAHFLQTCAEMGTRVLSLDSTAPNAHEGAMPRRASTYYRDHKRLPRQRTERIHKEGHAPLTGATRSGSRVGGGRMIEGHFSVSVDQPIGSRAKSPAPIGIEHGEQTNQHHEICPFALMTRGPEPIGSQGSATLGQSRCAIGNFHRGAGPTSAAHVVGENERQRPVCRSKR